MWDEEPGLSPIKVCVKPVTRKQLLSGNVNLKDDISIFDFAPTEGYEPGKPIIYYDLVFDEDELEQLHQYIDALPHPVIFVSYNGYKQNFPLLRYAIGHSGRSLPGEPRACDLMQAVFEIENDFGPQTPRDTGRMPWEYQRDPKQLSYAFSRTYERLTGNKYALSKERPILKADGGEGIPLPHMVMNIECVLAIAEQFLEWADRESSTTPLSEGRLPHEVRPAQLLGSDEDK